MYSGVKTGLRVKEWNEDDLTHPERITISTTVSVQLRALVVLHRERKSAEEATGQAEDGFPGRK